MSDNTKVIQVNDRADLEALYVAEEISNSTKDTADLVEYYDDLAAILRRVKGWSDLDLYRNAIRRLNGLNVSEPYANTFLKDLARSAA